MDRIVTVTINPAIDKSTKVGRVEPEHKLRCEDPVLEPGGGGLNVSRAIMNLGGESLALWACGGPMGDLLRQLLDTTGIDHDGLPIQGMTRENFIVTDTGSNRQYRFGMPGPRMTADEAGQFLERLKDHAAAYVVASGSLPPGVDVDFYGAVTRTATAAGSRVIVDTSGAALRAAVDDDVFLLKPNLRELQQIVDQELESNAAIAKAARGLIAEGHAQVVIVSLGGGGAMLVTREGSECIAAPTVPIRSKIGAGDSMVAGIVLALARGEDVSSAARFGVAAGAAAVMTAGTELCRRDDTERLYTEMAGGAFKPQQTGGPACG
jgi:6-phosphofructokinase 2